MRKEIEQILLGIQIEEKNFRKGKAHNILYIVILAIIFFLVPSYYPPLSSLLGIGLLIIFLGGGYILLVIPDLYQPLRREFYAFKKIVRAIEILNKSKETIAYEEAYQCLRHAHKILKKIDLDNLGWYTKINQTLIRFLENLQLIVLPAIANHSIKKEQLEEIAVALLSIDTSNIEAVNKMLETEPSYKKTKPSPPMTEVLTKKLRESIVGKLLFSLALGYGLVLLACLIYVVLTQQDFMIFAKDNPEIVILGGLGISGITFWKTKPQSQWKTVD